MLLSLYTGDESKPIFSYPHPDNKTKESYVLNLLNEGKIKDKNHVFNSDELSIRYIKHIIYLQPKREELMIVFYANCGVKADYLKDQYEDIDDTMHYRSIELFLNKQGQITSLIPSFDENPCKPDSKAFNNNHVKVDPKADFQVDFSFQENLTPKVLIYVYQLVVSNYLEFQGFTLKPHHFEIESIEYSELSLQNHHGIGINLKLLCDIPSKQSESIISPYLIQFFLFPNGEYSKLLGWFRDKIGKSCE